MALHNVEESRQLQQFLLSHLARRDVTEMVRQYARPYREY